MHLPAQKVVQANGANRFLRGKGDQGLHCGIKKDFHDTEDGIKRRDNRRFIADAADASMHAVRLHVRDTSSAWKVVHPFPKIATVQY